MYEYYDHPNDFGKNIDPFCIPLLNHHLAAMKISRNSLPKKKDWPLLVVSCTLIVVLMCLMVVTQHGGEEVSVRKHAEHNMVQDETRNVLHPPEEKAKFLRKRTDEEKFDDLKEQFLLVEDKLDKIHGVMLDDEVQNRDFLDKMILDGTNNEKILEELEEKVEVAEDKFKELEELFTVN
jgi:hypothetical protein